MGSKKHGQSGVAPKSPRLRLALKMEAEKNEKKAPKHEMVDTVKELFNP